MSREINSEKIVADFQSQNYTDKLRAKGEINIEIYFDTQDVQDMILGLRSVEGFDRINLRKFNLDKTFVQALAYFKFLGKIRMLPPHQDEIANFISNEYLIRDFLTLKDATNELLSEVGLLDLRTRKDGWDKTKIENRMILFKKESIRLFKANYLLYKLFWVKRLRYLLGNDNDGNAVIKFDDEKYDLNEVIEGDTFCILYDHFKERRPNKTNANFRDAMALSLLKEKLDDFRKDKNKPLPIFYSTSETIRIINSTPKLNSLFCFPIDEGDNHFSVLRGDYYFILDAIFNLEDIQAESYSALFNQLGDLRKIIGKNSDTFLPEVKLREELWSIVNDKFFISFWFDKIVRNQLSKSIEELIEYNDLVSLEDNKIHELINNERIELTKIVERNLNRLRLIKKVWISFENIEKFIATKINKSNGEGFDISTDFGLIRFGLKEKDQLDVLVNDLINSNDDNSTTRNFIKSKIMRLIFAGVYDKKYSELRKPLLLFFAFEEFEVINLILGLLGDLDAEHHQLNIIHGAALARSGRNRSVVNSILKEIEKSNQLMMNHEVRIGLSYIYYHLWKSISKPKIDKEVVFLVKENSSYIEKAIEHIEFSIVELKRKLKDPNELSLVEEENLYKKLFYSLNNLLYYKIRSTKVIDLIEITKLIDELQIPGLTASDSDYWQPRFAHTLAYAYYRLSFIKEIQSKKLNNLKTSLKWINISLETMPKNEPGYLKLKEEIENQLSEFN